MFSSRVIQLMALGVMVMSLAGSGWLLPAILEESDDRTLRYTDASIENAPPEVVLGNAIGALRGILVDVLWIRATSMKDRGLYYEANTLAEMITKLQPRFTAVWAFMGHNMAYNISVATHTQHERWEWVRKGIDLVRNQGLRANPNDVEMYKELSFWFIHKVEGVSDDAHLFYKRMLCREWHSILGPPPYDWEARTDWIKVIADAPDTLDEAEARTPGVKALHDELVAAMAPFQRVYSFGLDRNFLERYQEWRTIVGDSWTAQTLGAEAQIRAAAEAGDERARWFVTFDSLIRKPEYAEAWKTLIAHVRKVVLRDDYNMDARFMYELTKEWGPIDWRHGAAHALYWAMLGSKIGEKRFDNAEDISKIINNDRMAANAMQDLARFGDIRYDPGSDDMPNRLPDPRWIDAVEKLFVHLYSKHMEVEGWGSDNFIAWHQHFLESSVRELYRQGNLARAEQIYARLDSLYGRGHRPPNPQYAVPMDVFIKNKVFNEYQYQPHLSTTDVQNALYYGIVFGKAQNDEDKYEIAKDFAETVEAYFRGNEYSNFVNKFGEARINGILNELHFVEEITYARIMVDSSLPFAERMRIWNVYTPVEIKQQIYDDVLSTVRFHHRNSSIRNLAESVVFPEPPGMAEFRAAREAERLRSQQQQPGAPAPTSGGN
jgi:hypothetical protein